PTDAAELQIGHRQDLNCMTLSRLAGPRIDFVIVQAVPQRVPTHVDVLDEAVVLVYIVTEGTAGKSDEHADVGAVVLEIVTQRQNEAGRVVRASTNRCR